jgi:transposase-like protein
MELSICKRCEAENCVKNGWVREKQRWLCRECGCNFTAGDRRKERTTVQQRALAVLLVCVGLSYRTAGRIAGVVTNTVMVWFRKFAQSIELPEIEGDVELVEMDEMWHFLQKKKTKAGSGRPQRLLLVQLDSSMSQWGIVALEL